MFTMSCLVLVLAVLTFAKGVNLTGDLYDLLNNAPLFGDRYFHLYKRPEHIKEIETLRRVQEATPHPGLKYFQPYVKGKTLIVLDDFGVLLQIPRLDYSSAETLLKDLAANKNNEVWLRRVRDGTVSNAIVGPKIEIVVQDMKDEVSLDIGMYMKFLIEGRSFAKMTKLDSKNVLAYFYDTKTVEEFDPMAAKIRKDLADESADYELIRDNVKSVVEIKHIEANKGNSVDWLLGTGWYTKGVAIGNPTNSDGMFRAMNHANQGTGDSFHSVVVTEDLMRQTSAKYTLRDFHKAHKLLRELIPSRWDKIKAIISIIE
ncbi:hypothetical protein PTTG_25077 [Puccinia triticina 1-1 BBBD Race 1]|uniref:Uncharacterized protein n=2 Tax=Puccinia triticina TaxID=208348 RepID=A0A180H603_PUCT1|nr:uncharacterized protein PtA15_9A372 [Puccinia triticina]OAV99863.1 hypothetical protein PTTG_25077 [Puccinia triticina 1-1 BBBD Race 1]WAQ88245.1 hypothetical protein PtA15_9A372 [Puccinia triticina]